MNKIITIDGGVATGTSTLAKNLALVLGLPRIDSGSMYRAIAYLALHDGLDLNDAGACTQLAQKAHLEMPDGEVITAAGVTVVEWIDGERIDRLHTAEIDQSVPIVAAHKGVREAINKRQREFASESGAVADGRDCGTVVFPNADLKVFLVCGDAEAARRRSAADGRLVTVEEVKARNEADQNHKYGALSKADDAVEIDTTNLELNQVIDKVLQSLA